MCRDSPAPSSSSLPYRKNVMFAGRKQDGFEAFGENIFGLLRKEPEEP
jgi:hypothetical protein